MHRREEPCDVLMPHGGVTTTENVILGVYWGVITSTRKTPFYLTALFYSTIASSFWAIVASLYTLVETSWRGRGGTAL